ncbi:outer membrane beta-barrel protein [Acinetobacter sp. BSP-28]|uniref:outer membrane beta-barrel protein n=1 Tax=Acinetobacter sp. BSP-28 TaxID=3344661 RepID=UPI00377076AC
MKKLILTLAIGVISTFASADKPLMLSNGAPVVIGTSPNYVHTENESQSSRTSPFSVSFGYAGSKLGSDDFLGTESFDGVFVNAAYQNHPKASIWAEYIFQSSEVDYNHFSVGYKYKFLENEKLYSAASLGLGYAWLDESEIDPDLGKFNVELEYFTIPAALEVGYKVSPQVDMFGSFGYQWLFNEDAKVCLNGECLSGNGDELDLNGVTYKAGLRYNF